MKYVQHEHASHDPQVTARRDRATLLHRRVQILGLLAIPCLLIIVGVGLGPLPLPWIAFLAVFVMLLSLYLFNACLLRENPRLRKASRWRGFRSTYQESVMGLDEREKLVIDQAFRTSYRILAMACYLVGFCLFLHQHCTCSLAPGISSRCVWWWLYFRGSTLSSTIPPHHRRCLARERLGAGRRCSRALIYAVSGSVSPHPVQT